MSGFRAGDPGPSRLPPRDGYLETDLALEGRFWGLGVTIVMPFRPGAAPPPATGAFAVGGATFAAAFAEGFAAGFAAALFAGTAFDVADFAGAALAEAFGAAFAGGADFAGEAFAFFAGGFLAFGAAFATDFFGGEDFFATGCSPP